MILSLNFLRSVSLLRREKRERLTEAEKERLIETRRGEKRGVGRCRGRGEGRKGLERGTGEERQGRPGRSNCWMAKVNKGNKVDG